MCEVSDRWIVLVSLVGFEKLSIGDAVAIPYLISAVCTPLTEEEALHEEGLRAHLDQQAAANIDGVLIAGTMGLLQLLLDDTYQQLISVATEHWRGEKLVGVGDASFVRTRERIRFVNNFDIDGTVVLAPYFINFSQLEMVDYYESLAKESSAPLYMYDLPQRTGVELEFETVAQLARHPNIAGIKCSGDISKTRRVIDELGSKSFRVIVAQPTLIDVLLQEGICQHLDGIFSIVPHWIQEIAQQATNENWSEAALGVRRLTELLDVVRRYGVYQSTTALLNHCGIPGVYTPRPYRVFDEPQRQAFLQEPCVRGLLEDSVPADR